MSLEWHRLRPEQGDLPPLLFQYSCACSGYEVYVTDLTSIWSERLSRQAILKRADETSTTIDPSEDPGQLDVLLAKIGEALRGDGGNATLNSGPHGNSLELITKTKLPAPLRPLRWSLVLSKEDQSSLTSQLLLPLLREEAGWESRQRALLDQLKQKDWVLGKLFDKVETLGVDLGTVFPSAAGLRHARKGGPRSEAAKLVKGIAPFDEPAWLAESASSAGGSGLAANLVREITGSSETSELERLRPAQDKWWDALQGRPEISTQESKTTSSEEAPPEPQKEQFPRQSKADIKDATGSATESEDDEFQRQKTPPRLKAQKAESGITPSKPKAKKQSPPARVPAGDTDGATTSESEPEPAPAPPRPRRIPSPSPPKPATPEPQLKEAPKKPKGGLGVIGGKKNKEERHEDRAPSPQAPTSPQDIPKPAEFKEADASPPQTSPAKVKRPAKLGMIGGKAKAKAKAADSTELPPLQDGPVGSPDKLRSEDRPAQDSRAKGSTQSKASPIPPGPVEQVQAPPPETEEERASRRREELKRELEAKSKAPAKKKRRF